MGARPKEAPISFTGMLGAERKDPDESTFNQPIFALPQFSRSGQQWEDTATVLGLENEAKQRVEKEEGIAPLALFVVVYLESR
jgi:hypothetical protein